MKVVVEYQIEVDGQATTEEIIQLFNQYSSQRGCLLSEDIGKDDKFAIIVTGYSVSVR